IQWLTAIAAAQADDDIDVDIETGVFGHRVSMLDFSHADLAHFRRVGKLVKVEERPGQVEVALALSGSAAQSKIQCCPGDADYFERVNIYADTRAEACAILADLMRAKALATESGPTYHLIEVKFGSYPRDMQVAGQFHKAGAPIAWKPDQIRAGQIAAQLPDGTPTDLTWEQAAVEPGWCKFDWVIADPTRYQLANASNMLDATWEAPDGSITPLDGYLDPYFQEVYLDAEAIPVFSKLAAHVSPDSLANYVQQLEREVKKYTSRDLNYGKAAKRMYNIFRLTGRYNEAAYLRELFDEPAAALYQGWSLIRTIDECAMPGSQIDSATLLRQADEVILTTTRVLEGEKEEEVLRLLLRLRDALTRQTPGQGLTTEAEAVRAELINVVNNFFQERLNSVPAIKSYMNDLQPA
ncbi:MAG TPA: hypothetical protein VLS48_02785, partial [Anaerolineales bacterium]|nr:hypothetical protein [Anaerolineales bacterium]